MARKRVTPFMNGPTVYKYKHIFSPLIIIIIIHRNGRKAIYWRSFKWLRSSTLFVREERLFQRKGKH